MVTGCPAGTSSGMDTLTPDGMASAIERARYSGLRKEPWEELRDSERDTRIEVMRAALEQSGVTAAVATVVARGSQADGLAAEVAEREAELRARQAEHDADLVRLTGRIQDLEAELSEARAAHAAELTATSADYESELAEARSGEQRAVHRAQQAERALEAVRTALASLPELDHVPAPADRAAVATTATQNAVPSPVVAATAAEAGPRGLFGRRARAAH